jgi:hypothetical protein
MNITSQKLDYKNHWDKDHRYSITVYENEDKEHLSWLDEDGVKLFKKKFPKAVISIFESDDGHHLDEVKRKISSSEQTENVQHEVGDLVKIVNNDWLDDQDTPISGYKDDHGIVKNVHQINESDLGYIIEPFTDINHELYTTGEDLQPITNYSDEFLVTAGIHVSYTFRVKKQRKQRGVAKIKSRTYYKKHKFQIGVKQKRYKKKYKQFIKRREQRPHYHRF